MAGEKILIVEDEANISKLLKYNLEKQGYKVQVAEDGEAGLEAARTGKPDLIVLDVMLPKMDGFELCKTLRRESKTPILMLTARREPLDRIFGLEIGADDYVIKPFSIQEIVARVKAIFRRVAPTEDKTVLKAGRLELDTEKHLARLSGKELSLRAKELEVLRALFLAKGKTVSRQSLLDAVWGHQAEEIDARTVDQHVARLRDKLGPEASRIVTIKNVGYRMDRE
jgi:DNA-binding response OmpR family regulator